MRRTRSRINALRLLAVLLPLLSGAVPASVRAQDVAPQPPIADQRPAAAAEPAAGGADDVQPASTAATGTGEAEPERPEPVDAGHAEDTAPGGSGEPTPGEETSAATVRVAEPAARAGGTKVLPHDLSPWGMFQAADIVVKTVMVGLAIASFVTWTVWIAKGFELVGAKQRLRRAIKRINAAESLHDAVDGLGRSGGTAGALVRSAAEELVRSAPLLEHTSGDGILARVTSRLTRIEAAAARRITMGTGVLATIGATAPFVGLFGTVWGIMNAFIGISETQTTNLAVVAPGIAEALMATALGLVAAIPAVVIYNVFTRSTAGYRQLLADAAAGVERLVSRDLDFRHVRAAPAPAPFMRAAE